MKIQNYNTKNHYNLNTGTTIKGDIIMNYQEWCKVYDFLREEHAKAVKKINTYKSSALNNALNNFKRNEPFSIGITGTFEIAKEYNLLNKYKNQNYAIKIA